MKIRSQLYLFIAGIVIMPLLAVLFQRIMWRLSQSEQEQSVPVYAEVDPVLQNAVSSQEWDTIRVFISRLKQNAGFAIFRQDLLVLFSNIEGFASGEIMHQEQLLSKILSSDSRYSYSFDSPPWLGGGQFYLLLCRDRNKPHPPNPLALAFHSLLIIIAMIFVFSLVMSIIIARSISRSVTVLEESTRRIAAGELDLNVEVSGRGKNGGNEITSLAVSLNQMRLALKEDEQRRSRFIMGVSHDLKTPLALIKGYAEGIQDGVISGGEAQNQSMKIIAGKVDQLDGMINDLIGFVGLDTGQWRQQLETVRLAPFLAAFAKRFADDAELLGRRAECRISLPEAIAVQMDERLSSRALENLTCNALRYTPEGGEVTLSAYIAEGSQSAAIIEVADTGPGIAAADLPHVFEIFYRGDNSRRQQGMGLGLSVVKGITDSYGWNICAQSPTLPQGGGTRFRITIPLGEAEA